MNGHDTPCSEIWILHKTFLYSMLQSHFLKSNKEVTMLHILNVNFENNLTFYNTKALTFFYIELQF